MTRWLLGMVILLFVTVGMTDQPNPFEVKSRLPKIEQSKSAPAQAQQPSNPFDVTNAPRPIDEQIDSLRGSNSQGPLLIRRNNEPAVLDARGRTLGIPILLLFLAAMLWIFFRPFLSRCYRAIFNDGLLSQLFRQRENGQGFIFYLCVALFFLAGGFFIYLVGQAFEVFPSDQPWQYWTSLSLLLFTLIMSKHVLLRILSWLFPIEVEVSKYNFAIMVFGIVNGMLLVPVNLLISYAPSGSTKTVVFLSMLTLGGLYILRSFRGLLIANRFIGTQPLHFLLYICVVEVAPILILYRYLVG